MGLYPKSALKSAVLRVIILNIRIGLLSTLIELTKLLKGRTSAYFKSTGMGGTRPCFNISAQTESQQKLQSDSQHQMCLFNQGQVSFLL